MLKLRWSFAALLPLVLSGCYVTSSDSGLGETVREPGTTDLPTGAALLETEQEECEGTVQVGNVTVNPGENATLRVTGDEIEWACLVADDDYYVADDDYDDDDARVVEARDVEETQCPDGTTHVRVTRASTGDEFIFECYGA